MPEDEELEGTTLKVYLYMVKEGKPVGPRDVMRGAFLSSPSVAYRHLQKLETLGFVLRNAHGDYVLKEKVNIGGHLWIGRNLVPRLIFYSFFFIGILSAETVIIAVRLLVHEPLQTDFVFLCIITIIATVLFFSEGVISFLKLKRQTNSGTESRQGS